MCGHEVAGVRPEELCEVCGASLPAGQRVCPYCGAARRAPILGVLPLVGRIATSLAILALGAVLVWWILPLGLATDDLPSTDQPTGTPAIVTPMLVELLQEPAGTSSAAVAQVSGQPTTDVNTVGDGAAVPTAEPTAVAATPTATPEPATEEPPLTAAATTYAVVQGDFAEKIATLYGISLASLLEANGLSDSSILHIGDALVIPIPPTATAEPPAPETPTAASPTASATGAPATPTSVAPTAAPVASSGRFLHVVAAGETLGALAVLYQVDSDEIAAENGISVNAVLRIGQQLIIPLAASTPSPTAAPTETERPSPTATPTTSPSRTPTVTAEARATAAPVSTEAPARTTPAATRTASPPASATLLPSTTPPPAPTLRVHVVKAGEHIGIIAAIYDLTMQEIAAANDMSMSDLLQVGQELLIPGPEGSVVPPTTTPTGAPNGTASALVTPEPTSSATPEPQVHVVQKGDTLSGIAVRYQVDSAAIAQANGLALSSTLSIGQELLIPGATPDPTAAPTTDVAAATATPQASASPTPFPYRTRPSAAAYRQPRLLTPVNGAIVVGKDSIPFLQWTSVGILGTDEWYQVRLWTPDSGTDAQVYRTRATSWRLEPELYPQSRRDDRFLWDVTVVRLIDTAPGEESLSLASKQRAFRWR
jgi:LysM repeat protein